MKRILFCILLLLSLSACGNNTGRDSCNNDVCVKLTAEEPIIIGKPVTLTIVLTSQKDIPDLEIYLVSELNTISFEEPSVQGWKERDVNWTASAKTDQPLTFTRKAILPVEEGLYLIIVDVGISSEGLLVSDAIRIWITKDGGKVHYQGMEKFPITVGPLPTMDPKQIPTPDATQLYLGTPSP